MSVNVAQRRLLFVSHSQEIGGAESYLRSLMLRARQCGADVSLVCRRDQALDAWVSSLEQGGVPVHRLNLKRPADYASFWRLARRAELVHLVLAYPVGKYQLLAAILARLARRPLVITHQLTLDLTGVTMAESRRRLWWATFRRYGRMAQRHIAVSNPGRQLLLARYGFPAARVSVIFNGIELARYRRLDDNGRKRVRRQMSRLLGVADWPDDVPLTLTVARLNVQKGLRDLLSAAALLRERVPAARFVIVGGGELEVMLAREIASLGLKARVHLAGPQPTDTVSDWLAAADLFVLASHDEGLPIALVEAMASGCAAVATRVGGVPDVIADDSIGVLVPAHDPPRLAEAIVRLLDEPERRRALAERGQAMVRTRFDLDRCLDQTLELYPEVLAGRIRRGKD